MLRYKGYFWAKSKCEKENIPQARDLPALPHFGYTADQGVRRNCKTPLLSRVDPCGIGALSHYHNLFLEEARHKAKAGTHHVLLHRGARAVHYCLYAPPRKKGSAAAYLPAGRHAVPNAWVHFLQKIQADKQIFAKQYAIVFGRAGYQRIFPAAVVLSAISAFVTTAGYRSHHSRGRSKQCIAIQ